MKFETTIDYSKINLSLGLMIDEALRRGISVSEDLDGLRVLKKGKTTHLINHQETDQVGRVSVKATHNKLTCKKLLQRAGLSTPIARSFDTTQINQAVSYLKGKKRVLKPLDSDYGNLVFTDIRTDSQFKNAFKKIAKTHKKILIEEFFQADDYRIFTTKKKTFACIRIPANVVGDGKTSISDLVKKKNISKTIVWKGTKLTIGEIKRSKIETSILRDQNLNWNSVPKLGQTVYLRQNANISTGGDSIDITDQLSPSIKKITRKALDAIPGLTYAGIDILLKKLPNNKITKNDYTILEVNNMPGLKCHYFPIKGKPRNVCGAILDQLF